MTLSRGEPVQRWAGCAPAGSDTAARSAGPTSKHLPNRLAQASNCCYSIPALACPALPQIRAYIEQNKGKGYRPHEFPSEDRWRRVWEAYERELRHCNLLDFADMLLVSTVVRPMSPAGTVGITFSHCTVAGRLLP